MKTKTTIHLILGIIAAVSLMHLLILFGVINYQNAWGGRLKNEQQMYVFETLSLLINLFLVYVLLIKAGYIKGILSGKAIRVVLWIYCLLFALNTIGNLLAVSSFEKMFSLLTLLLCLLIWKVVRDKKRA